jgi:N-acetylneuraminic acid mutarotase
VILFGGGTEDSEYGDTWAYDPAANQWTELAPGGDQPAGRSMFALAYDSRRHQALIFGGGGITGPLNDTWVYDPAAELWTESEPAGDLPPERWATSAVYDPASGATLLFGGGALDGMLNDTWAFDPEGGSWRALDPPGAMPGPRGYLQLVQDPESGKVILFGGGTENDDFRDTWAYDPGMNTWTYLDPAGPVPAERSGYAMVHNGKAGVMILFGGTNTYESFNDTWVYDPATDRWTELAPEGVVPSPRAFHAMVYDSKTSQVIMFGGYDGYQYLNDTWSYDRDTNTWTELIPATGEALETRTRVRRLS